jgi:hypothetical protein
MTGMGAATCLANTRLCPMSSQRDRQRLLRIYASNHTRLGIFLACRGGAKSFYPSQKRPVVACETRAPGMEKDRVQSLLRYCQPHVRVIWGQRAKRQRCRHVSRSSCFALVPLVVAAFLSTPLVQQLQDLGPVGCWEPSGLPGASSTSHHAKAMTAQNLTLLLHVRPWSIATSYWAPATNGSPFLLRNSRKITPSEYSPTRVLG